MQNPDLVCQKTGDSKSLTHSRPAGRCSRQAIQARPDHPDRVVCHEVQEQITSVCVTGTGSPGVSSGCSQSVMGGSIFICIHTDRHLGQSGGEVAGLPLPKDRSD